MQSRWSIITNSSSLEDKLYLESNINKHIFTYFPNVPKDIFNVSVYHPSEEEFALMEVMEIDDKQISYSLELKYDADYYVYLIETRLNQK